MLITFNLVVAHNVVVFTLNNNNHLPTRVVVLKIEWQIPPYDSISL